jgi:hypothetical protein
VIHQNDPAIQRFCPELWHYGCAMLSLAYYKEKYLNIPWTARKLMDIWCSARAVNIITGDLNSDGDMEDAGECEIRDWNGLCGLMGLDLEYVPGHFSPVKVLDSRCYSVCAWYNPNTKFTHFVVGTHKPVEFDPIGGGSRTVREGAPKQDGLRIFRRSI